MSGGVDSSAVAYLYQKQGYEVIGLTMDILQKRLTDAEKVAKKLGIEHHYVDLHAEFNQKVVEYFIQSYRQGLTPSPCIMCNQEIKLGILAEKAFELGADFIATGHYAKIKDGKLYKGSDPNRDQSYFLFGVKKAIFKKLLCPLADLSKEETRSLAFEAGLEIHNKKDSQDVCFVENGKYQTLFNPPPPCGNIVDKNGKILAKHNGIINYTIGQRRGLNIGGGEILYVTGIDADKNQVVVGSIPDMIKTQITINNINWLGDEEPKDFTCEVKLRSRQQPIPADIHFLDNNTAEVIFKEPVSYGIASGQGCCFFAQNQVLGGGFII